MQPDPLAYDSSLSSLAIILPLIIGFVLLIGGIKLIKHGNAAFIGTVLFGLAIVPLFLLGMCLLGMWVGYQSVAVVPERVHQAIDGVEHVTDNLTNTLGDLEKELDEFTKPQIDLSEETETPDSEEEPAEESSTELESEPKLGEPLPDWVTNPPKAAEGVWQRVVSTELELAADSTNEIGYMSREGAILKAIKEYLSEHTDSDVPESYSYWLPLHRKDQPEIAAKEFTERRETSFGEIQFTHLLIQIDETAGDWFLQLVEVCKEKDRLIVRRGNAVGARILTGILSGVVLCGLAVVYGLLRMTEK